MNIKKIFLNLLLSALILSPTQALAHGTAKSNWHQYYQPINDTQVETFLNDGIEYLSQILGEPNRAIKTVHLRFSQPLIPQIQKANFQLTELTDVDNGIFTIYLNPRSSRSQDTFYGQLGHEMTHLFNARIEDAYFEGFCTVMSEKYSRSKGMNWDKWRNYFESGHEPFYGQTYFMMKDIEKIVGEKAFYHFHTYTMETRDGRLSIDINRWISQLKSSEQEAVKSIISRYAVLIQQNLRQEPDPVAFTIPAKTISLETLQNSFSK